MTKKQGQSSPPPTQTSPPRKNLSEAVRSAYRSRTTRQVSGAALTVLGLPGGSVSGAASHHL